MVSFDVVEHRTRLFNLLQELRDTVSLTLSISCSSIGVACFPHKNLAQLD